MTTALTCLAAQSLAAGYRHLVADRGTQQPAINTSESVGSWSVRDTQVIASGNFQSTIIHGNTVVFQLNEPNEAATLVVDVATETAAHFPCD